MAETRDEEPNALCLAQTGGMLLKSKIDTVVYIHGRCSGSVCAPAHRTTRSVGPVEPLLSPPRHDHDRPSPRSPRRAPAPSISPQPSASQSTPTPTATATSSLPLRECVRACRWCDAPSQKPWSAAATSTLARKKREAESAAKAAPSSQPGRNTTKESACSPDAAAASSSAPIFSAAASMIAWTNGGFAAYEPERGASLKKEPREPKWPSTSTKAEANAGSEALSGEAKHSHATPKRVRSSCHTGLPMAAWNPWPRRLL
eukprot:421079-Pleurochrysis_carterae.AAC.2